ncbi:MAG: hypothetical protein NT019_00440 [Candidatus Adlerbacteria bacterium]|nr:hypothetical protein [Candidatus Adlerbacteria bacterium]
MRVSMTLRRMLPKLIPFFLLCVIVGYGYYVRAIRPYPEVTDIVHHEDSFSELNSYFKDIAVKKGALYAFEILRRAPLPPQTDIHLLGHTVGDELYKQYGKDAIQYCTDEFRNACSHTVVVGLLLDYGEKALDDISESCKKAPGGSGAYTMCFHGLGHGVLAYENYNLEKTIALCKKTGTRAAQFEEYPQCVGGAIMELISGGGHSPEVWSTMRPQYLTTADPLSPCDKPYMPKEVRAFCYIYVTPHLIEAAGGDKNHPDPAVFPKAFSLCRALPVGDQDRDVCIGSFGKEFIWWARQSDARDITTLTDEELARMTSWCSRSGNAHDTTLCVESIQDSLYWGGENDPKISAHFCALLGVQDPVAERSCTSYVQVLTDRYTPHTSK